mgnify:CR=1 FL=1
MWPQPRRIAERAGQRRQQLRFGIAMTTGDPRQRLLVYFSGRVQGVGFRYTTRRVASEFPVSGYVRNLVDGRVEVVAEGSRQTVKSFVDRINEVMKMNIDHCDIHRSEASGEFDNFEIRH